ncbi:MAG: hypothetical protein KDB88_07780 [Flavobacteriales bacterium]|nr:hypothetical protein [Flavobacteriales bacterium]
MKGREELLIFVATGIACSALTAVALYALGFPISWHYGLVILYFTGLTIILHRWQTSRAAADPKGMVRRFMGSLVLKMFMSVVLVALILLATPSDLGVPLALCFATCYLVFLAVGSVLLSRTMRQGNHA